MLSRINKILYPGTFVFKNLQYVDTIPGVQVYMKNVCVCAHTFISQPFTKSPLFYVIIIYL